MKRSTEPLCFTFLMFSLLLSMGEVARGNLVTTLSVSTIPEPGGLTLYSYTLTNETASTLNAEGLGISVSTDASLSSINGPNGWDLTYFSGFPLVTWESSDPSTDLLPGQSAVFSFESPLAPIQQAYLVSGLDSTGTIFDTNSGNIASPGVASVPEPNSLALSGIGALVLITLLNRRSRRASSSVIQPPFTT